MLRKFLMVLIALVFLPIAVPVAQAETPWRFTLADLGYKDLVAKSVFDRLQVHFTLVEGRKIERAVLELQLSHERALLPGLSRLSVGLNDEPAVNLSLTPENASKNIVEIDLPTQALQPGDNVLVLQFRMRLKDTGCSDIDSPKLWARIDADSAITLEGGESAIAPDVERFPAPFDTLSTLPGSPQLLFILPPQPTPAELTATVRIAAALGQAARWQTPPLRVVTADQVNPSRAADDHLLVISSVGRNPFAERVPSGVVERTSPWNPKRLMLIVAGEDDLALLRAADSLSTQAGRQALGEKRTSATTGSPASLPARSTTVTFADLGREEWRARGIGQHDSYYPLDVPNDWRITSEASLEISFQHARNLASTSTLTAFLNGRQLATVPLSNRNAGAGRLVVQLSPRQLHPGRNWLHLAFGLHLKREDCSLRYLDEAWAIVSADRTVLNLAHVVSEPPLELRFLPSPLLTPPDLSADLFVVPAQPTSMELYTMVGLATKLGTFSDAATLSPRATTATQFDSRSADTDHVIAIGRPETNELLARYDARLHLPFSQVDEALAEATVNQPAGSGNTNPAACIQMLPAPWSRRAVLVVVGAPDDAALAEAVRVFPTLGHPLRIRGNVALVEQGRVIGLDIGGLSDAPLSAPLKRVVFAVLAGAVLVIGGVAAFASRRKHNGKSEQDDAEE